MTVSVTGRQSHAPVFHRVACWLIAVGVFFTAYLTWRPFEQLFTLSDFLFSIALVALTMAGRLPLRPLGSLTGPWYLCVALLLTGLFASSLVNGDPARWLTVALQYSFAMLALPMLLVQHDRRLLQRFALALVLGVAAMQLFGSLVYLLDPSSFWELRARYGIDFISGGRRLGAFLSDANWNGAIIGMTLPFAFHLMVERRLPLLPGMGLVCLLVLGLFLTGSFTGFTSTLLAVMIYATVAGVVPSWRALTPVAGFVALYVASGAPLPEAFAKRVAPAFADRNIAEAGTFEGRWGLIEEAWEISGQTPILGLGVDQYRVESLHGAPVHNMFLLVWTEGGVAALTGWLGLLAVLVAIPAVALRYDRRAAALGLAVVAVFIIQSTASPHMYARLWFVPVMLAAGFAILAARMKAQDMNAMLHGGARA